MMKGLTILLVASSLVLFGLVAAAPPGPPSRVVEKRAAPTVTLAAGTVVGLSRLATEAFNGIPYALPPVGNLRLKPPVRLTSNLGTFDATGVPNACPQFFVSTAGNDLLSQVLSTVTNLPFFQAVLKTSEDCLTINVIRPAGTKAGDKLPVLFWIFGGGFEVGHSLGSDQ